MFDCVHAGAQRQVGACWTFLLLDVFGGFDNVFGVVEVKKEKFNSLCD